MWFEDLEPEIINNANDVDASLNIEEQMRLYRQFVKKKRFGKKNLKLIKKIMKTC